MDLLEVNAESLAKNLSLEVVRLVKEKKDVCLSIIELMTGKDNRDIFDEAIVEEKHEFFLANLDETDMASLLTLILSNDKTSYLFDKLGIDAEEDRMRAVMRAKESSGQNDIQFGGLSVFGTLIDAACERYGWSKEYVVWGIDYPSLRLMLADKVSSIYVTDEEKKKIPLSARSNKNESVKGTKENMERIKAMGWK